MENTFAFRLLTSQFNEHRQLTKTTIAGNFLMAIPFLLTNPKFLWQNLHVQFSLISAILILMLVVFYNWKKPTINLIIVVVYLGLFIMEFIMVGIPNNPMSPEENMGRGILLGLIIMFVPGIYMAVRLALVIPLIQVSLSSIKLMKSS